MKSSSSDKKSSSEKIERKLHGSMKVHRTDKTYKALVGHFGSFHVEPTKIARLLNATSSNT